MVDSGSESDDPFAPIPVVVQLAKVQSKNSEKSRVVPREEDDVPLTARSLKHALLSEDERKRALVRHRRLELQGTSCSLLATVVPVASDTGHIFFFRF
jgi:hypothetical protein